MGDENPIDPPIMLPTPDGELPQPTSLDPYPQQFSQNPSLIPELYAFLFKNTAPKGSQPNEFTARGSWTQQEDEQLIQAVSQLGPKKWIDIAKFVPTRTSKQCRERWHHRLDPQIKHEPFEPWEDQVIIEKQREIGNRWAVIAHQLPGRSASAVKNRWYSGLKAQHPTHAQMEISLGLPPQVDLQNPSVSQLDGVEQESVTGVLNPPSTDL